MRRNNKELELKENIAKLIFYCIRYAYKGNTIDYNIFLI